MKLTSVLLALFGAEAVLANPVVLVPRDSRAAKRAFQRKTSPPIPIADGNVSLDSVEGNDTAQVSYSSNWAGAVLIGSGYKSVVGTIKVPTPKTPSGGSSSTTYSASAWVGIDGDTCQTAILQTGIDFNVRGSSVSFDAWYEWYPDYAYTFSGFAVSAGDSIRMTATATSTSAGSVKIENLTTGKSVSHSFSGESDMLCETNAEWIVEDFSSGGSLVPFANFGTVTFTGASATTGSGTVGVSGAQIFDIKQGNTVHTDCSVSGSSTVTCNLTLSVQHTGALRSSVRKSEAHNGNCLNLGDERTWVLEGVVNLIAGKTELDLTIGMGKQPDTARSQNLNRLASIDAAGAYGSGLAIHGLLTFIKV
ncbi:uncharacterized protein E0L32_011172 [Thyridium curvatum]|uniref:Uncharacterized protein n=1 Tax=Thyridium curvatum TaxID=1093900 RepID=A0A507BNH4_9PEZI|nr:uncharacterized protein E0L32_011172 [Thyridium curvatum]TPX19099.1 hypothetical protein E0L32_011172 [Thyridium curvatum]